MNKRRIRASGPGEAYHAVEEGTCTRVDGDADLLLRRALDRLAGDTRAAAERAQIIVVPDDGFRDHSGPIFPEGTVGFYRFLRDEAPSGIQVEIAVEECEYQEVVLHSDIIRLATLSLEYVLLPVAASLIANYLFSILRNRSKDAEIRLSLIVTERHNQSKKTVRLSYEGPARAFEKVLTRSLASRQDIDGSKTVPNTPSVVIKKKHRK